MIVIELIRELEKACDAGHGLSDVHIVHASNGNPDQKVSGKFPLLLFDAETCVLVQSNYISHYVPKVFELDKP